MFPQAANTGPPDIIIVLLLLLFDALIGGIGFVIVFLIMKASRQKIKAKTILVITATFAILFLLSTVWVRDIKDGVSHQIFGHEPYAGADFSHGFPFVFMSIFRPYDTSAQRLYVFPVNFSLQNFLIDFILWLVVSTVLVLAAQKIRSRAGHK